MDRFSQDVMWVLERTDRNEMDLRELVRAYIEERDLPEEDAYLMLSDLYQRIEDPRQEDVLLGVLDCLSGYCSPSMTLGSGMAAETAERRLQRA